MKIFHQDLLGNRTHCPPLTHVYTEKDDTMGCAYYEWVYALFALGSLIIVGIPFVAFICYVHRRIQSKQRLRRLTHSTSLENSSPYPYQPLHHEGAGRANYGAIDSSVDNHHAIRSPSHGSTASLTDRLSQQQDTTSVASSRASMIPNYDDVSLNYHNAVANKTHGAGAIQPPGKTAGRRSSKSSHLSNDSQEKAVDQGGPFYSSVDVVSNVPKLPSQPVAKDMKQPPPKPPRQQNETDTNTTTTKNPIYDEVEGSDQVGVFQPPSNAGPLVVPEGAVKPTEGDQSPVVGDEKPHGSPEYAILEPFPENPNDGMDPTEDQTPVNDKGQKNLSPSEQKLSLPDDKQPLTDPDTAGSSPLENKYLTVLPLTPPKQTDPLSENKGLLQSSGSFDQMSVSPTEKSAAKSRTDFEEFLLGKVRAMPANERNGTFLVRDSVSSTGSKVLTMYCWKPDSNKELYNFKVSLTDNGLVYLHKSSKKFPDLNGLLGYLREQKDMLPCVLTTQVSP